jgi:hypothetical protein
MTPEAIPGKLIPDELKLFPPMWFADAPERREPEASDLREAA